MTGLCNILSGESVTIDMFCPKCGAQNLDESKFCRGCGTDVGNVLAATEGRPTLAIVEAEKQIDYFARGLMGLMIGCGFLIVSGLSFAISERLAVLGIFALAFSFFFLSIGVSRLVQARALKRLREPTGPRSAPELSAGDMNYIRPTHSIYETDELAPEPGSVTERTTTLLDKK